MSRAVAVLLSTVLVTAATARVAQAAEPTLVRDIATAATEGGSAPQNLIDLGGRAVFTAFDPSHGTELWATDGSPDGSRRIQEICPGSCSTRFDGLWVAAGRWFFRALPRYGGASTPDEQGPGRGLWSTDGTRAGTHFLGDLSVVDYLGTLETAGVHVFLVHDETHGVEPWRSDGTAAGTYPLGDLNPGPDGSAGPRGAACAGAAVRGGHLLFAATTPEAGCELWRTDGWPEGTALVRDIRPGDLSSYPSDLVSVGARVVFHAIDGTHGDELWASDGTRAGTSLVNEIVPGEAWAMFASSSGRNFRSANGHAYFLAARQASPSPDAGNVPWLELWQTDGTAAGTRQLTHFGALKGFFRSPFDPDLPFYVYLRLAVVGPRVYFVADDGQHGIEPWVSDGTPAGTHLLEDLCPGPCDSEPVLLQAVGDRGVLFEANDGTHGREIWISDGTPGGTRLAADQCAGDCSSLLVDTAPLGGQLAYTVRSESGGTQDQIWITGATEATTRRLAAWEYGAFYGISLRVPMAELGDQVLFSIDDGVHGPELWATAGTPGSTRLLSDLVGSVGAGSHPTGMVRHGSRVFFMASDGEHGFEPWTSDGTTAGTQPLLEVPPDCTRCSSGIQTMRSIGGLVYYWVDQIDDRLWRSDGTAAGTFPLIEGRRENDEFGELAGRVYFASGTGLWHTDGTVAGTERVGATEFGRAPSFFVPVGDRLLFTAGASTSASTLWATDGTAAGTRIVSDEIESTEAGGGVIEAAGRAAFGATDGQRGYDLWTSDGTAAGTRRLTDLGADPASGSIAFLGAVGDRVVFEISIAGHGRGLWAASIGSGDAVELLRPPADARHAVAGSKRGEEVLYFVVDDDAHGTELWRTDGTLGGTRLVRDIWPGPGSADPFLLTPVGETLFFTAFEPTRGRQIWRTDGTPAGTFQVTAVDSGLAFSDFEIPGQLSWLGDQILFAASDGEHGEELWKLPVDAGPAGPGAGPPGGGDPQPPAGAWLSDPDVPGFRFKVRITQGPDASIPGTAEPVCIPETLCVSGAVSGRSEVFVRVVGPKPNGKLWPTLVKFTTSQVEVWIEQLGSGAVQYYRLTGAAPGVDELPGLFDRDGFDP